MADQNKNLIENINNLNEKKNFICGVVEGFYGRPWTPEQRKDLFVKQQKWGMNCYLYAPKDDYKHRAYWRELYTVEEAEHLRALINEARQHNIIFYYAISPGLDVTYSSQKEISALKRKLEQVQQLGCNAFAVLFDDIDPEMSSADKEVFHSFAHAQVSVTNEVFTHLGQPKFMFCPTQYCSTRAVPSVQTSEYLTTLGSKLAPEIDIMWTGSKVITKVLTVEHIREVTEVMKRPPVIWDNLHANDYDQARLFLGPYCGRSPDLIKLLRGVVTNPNCEYGPNFIAIHTLAQWSKSSADTNCGNNDAVSADIKLETEGDDSTEDIPTGLSPLAYHPRRALKLALIEWLDEFDKSVPAFGPIQQPQIPTPVPILPSVNTCMSVTVTTPATPGVPPQPNINLVVDAIQDSFNPIMNPVMNSLVSENKVIVDSLPDEAETGSTVSQDASSTSGLEPMDCVPTPSASPAHNEDAMMIEKVDTDTQDLEDNPRIDECDNKNSIKSTSAIKNSLTLPIETTATQPLDEDDKLTVEDLQLLADLFYLPFEHGKTGGTLLGEFNWLKINSHLVTEQNQGSCEITKPEVQEWYDRAKKFDEMSKLVKTMANRLYKVKNRSLLYELYPYVWDMRGVISLLNSYIEWLALGQVSPLVINFVHGNYTWFSKGWREAFMSGDQEPWVFRGGLTAELQRLIPVDASNDLFAYKTPCVPLSSTFVIRPYLPDDKRRLYDFVMKVADDNGDGSKIYTAHPDLKAEIVTGSFINDANDSITMIIEDDSGIIVGYCFALNNSKIQASRQLENLNQLSEKYPKVSREEGTLLTPCEELLASLSSEPKVTPELVTSSYPSCLTISVLPTLIDDSMSKRLLACVLASLRSQGCFGVHACLNLSEPNTLQFYNRLGFFDVSKDENIVYVGRSF